MLRNMRLAALASVSLSIFAMPAYAQTYRDSGGAVVQGIVPVGGNQSGPLFTPSNPGSVTGTFSTSFSGFQPTPSYSYQSVTTTSATYALPTGTVAVFYNTGSTAITVKLGSSSVTVVAGQGDVIQPGSWMSFTVGSGTYYYAVVGNGGTSSVVASGGAGLPTGAGGGGGGGGAATIADGADVTQGSIGDSPWSGTGNGTLDAIMKAIYNAVISPPTPGSTTGGLTFVTKTGINGTPQQIGTTGAHQVYVEHCDNGTSALNTANTYLQYYDTATTPTFGTSVTFSDPIAGSLTDGFALSLVGGQIANGIWITAATAPSGNTAPTNSLTCLFGYK